MRETSSFDRCAQLPSGGHQNTRCKRSVGIHWGTWHLSSEPVLEPPVRFREAAAAAGLPKGECDTLAIGETIRTTV